MAGKGGARSVSGPPPDPNAIRRDSDKRGWTQLPAAGRTGEPPAWPLTRATARELRVWAEEWKRPQAIMWAANHQEREVALYVRALTVAEGAAARVQERTLVRQLMDDLGVSLVGMARHRWLIEAVAEQRPTNVRTDDIDHRAAKARLRSIAGGAA